MQFKPFPIVPLRHIFTAAGDDLIEMAQKLLDLYPLNRCSCTEALQMPYFSNKPAPTIGSKLPMPSTHNTEKIFGEKPHGLKRKLLENIDSSLPKRLQF